MRTTPFATHREPTVQELPWNSVGDKTATISVRETRSQRGDPHVGRLRRHVPPRTSRSSPDEHKREAFLASSSRHRRRPLPGPRLQTRQQTDCTFHGKCALLRQCHAFHGRVSTSQPCQNEQPHSTANWMLSLVFNTSHPCCTSWTEVLHISLIQSGKLLSHALSTYESNSSQVSPWE